MRSILNANGGPNCYRTWLMDSQRWDAYRPRVNDVVVATYPKSGTTWMQRIVSLLIFQSSEVVQLDRIFPWWERRTGAAIETIAREFEAQSHQRSVKTHLPLDGLPVYDEVKYIHVVRDGRDTALSYHNHCYLHTPESISHLDQIGMKDDTLKKPYPEIQADPADFFHEWLTKPAIEGQPDGAPTVSYFEFERSYEKAFGLDNFLFIHYNDLLDDLVGEMAKIADFLNIGIQQQAIAKLAEAASFEQMRKDGERLIPLTTVNFINGASGFFKMGESGGWKGVFRKEDLMLFDQKINALPKEYLTWMTRE